MAQTTIDSALIRKFTIEPGYESVFELAALEKAGELLSTTLADANITNRKLEKERDYCKRITSNGVTAKKNILIWNILNKLRIAGQTLDPDNILLNQDDPASDFSKLKTGVGESIPFFAGVQAGDETQPPVNTDAPDYIPGDGVPNFAADKEGQEYGDKTGRAFYKAITAGTGSTDWIKL